MSHLWVLLFCPNNAQIVSYGLASLGSFKSEKNTLFLGYYILAAAAEKSGQKIER